jgi:hypothetical protein
LAAQVHFGKWPLDSRAPDRPNQTIAFPLAIGSPRVKLSIGELVRGGMFKCIDPMSISSRDRLERSVKGMVIALQGG